jgi:P-type Cu+ transporter
MVTDPVCEMQVDEANSTIEADYNGKTFYFCSEECKEVFQTDPAPYANKVA